MERPPTDLILSVSAAACNQGYNEVTKTTFEQ